MKNFSHQKSWRLFLRGNEESQWSRCQLSRSFVSHQRAKFLLTWHKVTFVLKGEWRGLAQEKKAVLKESAYNNMMKVVFLEHFWSSLVFHKPCVNSHLSTFKVPPGDASVELREQALIGGAALAALAQALTSLVGVSRFFQRSFSRGAVNIYPGGVGQKIYKPPKDGKKQTNSFWWKGSIKCGDFWWFLWDFCWDFWVGCIKIRISGCL